MAVREVDDWVIGVWLGDGKKREQLHEQVLLLVFRCVAKGSVN